MSVVHTRGCRCATVIGRADQEGIADSFRRHIEWTAVFVRTDCEYRPSAPARWRGSVENRNDRWVGSAAGRSPVGCNALMCCAVQHVRSKLREVVKYAPYVEEWVLFVTLGTLDVQTL